MNKKTHQHAQRVEGDEVGFDTLTVALDALYASGPAEEATRAATLALDAHLSEVLPNIYYDRLDASPLGPVWLALGARGLVAIEYNGSEASFRGYLTRATKGRLQRSAAKLAAAKGAVLAYISGETSQLELDVDLSHITDFQRRVLQETRKIPRGQVATYAQIAKRLGKPLASRAVGQALRRNPVPIVVPCHRVISSDGSLGGYGGEMRSRRKLQLLELEGALLA